MSDLNSFKDTFFEKTTKEELADMCLAILYFCDDQTLTDIIAGMNQCHPRNEFEKATAKKVVTVCKNLLL